MTSYTLFKHPPPFFQSHKFIKDSEKLSTAEFASWVQRTIEANKGFVPVQTN